MSDLAAIALDASRSAVVLVAIRGLGELAAGLAGVPRLWWPPGLPACLAGLSPAEALDRDSDASREPEDDGSAQAAPAKANIAAPVPRATASPPTRQTNVDDVTRSIYRPEPDGDPPIAERGTEIGTISSTFSGSARILRAQFSRS